MIDTACLQCGTPAGSSLASFCRRCGLPYGERPRADVELPSCPICYQTVDDDGRLPSLERIGLRVDLVRHQGEHDTHPVGDDDWLESLREGDRIRSDGGRPPSRSSAATWSPARSRPAVVGRSPTTRSSTR